MGLRDDGNFIALIEAGHVPAVRVVTPATGRLQQYLRPEDVAAFHRRFATLTTRSAQTGRHRNTLRGQLAACGVTRFAPGGRDFGALYLREEVIPALDRAQGASPRITTRKARFSEV